MRYLPVGVLCAAAIWLGSAVTAKADLINFEAQGTGASSIFTGAVNSPLVISVATFTGGQLLNDEIASTDETAVYATTNLLGGAYTDPLVIHFSTAVSSFSILLTNEIGDTFTVADNMGGSQSAAVGTDTSHTFSLSDSGITSVTIASSSTAEWDFAIDNVQFTQVASAVPEPSGWLLLASVVGIVGGLARRKAR
jgi:hypothetical protein